MLGYWFMAKFYYKNIPSRRVKGELRILTSLSQSYSHLSKRLVFLLKLPNALLFQSLSVEVIMNYIVSLPGL